MDDNKKEKNNTPTLKAALKSVVAPLLIGVRNDLKSLGKKFDAFKGNTQKTEVTNFPEQNKEIRVSNFPEQTKVEVTNPQKEVKVKGLGDALSTLKDAVVKRLSTTTDSIVKSIGELKDSTIKVTIENQKDIEFPKEQKVKMAEDQIDRIIKELKQEVVQRVKIDNSTPGEAIPVVLTEKTKKRFYDAISQMITGGANLGNVKDKLDQVIFELQNLEVNIEAGDIQIGAVEIKDDDTDTRLSVENDGGKNAAYVQSNSLNQEATQLLVKSELTAIKGFVDGIEALLTSIDGKDFSTETTLASLLTAFNAEDFATEATLALIKAQTDLLTFIAGRLQVDADVKNPSASTGAFGSVSVGTTATLVRASKSDRISFLATISEDKTVFWGTTSSVTTANGFPLAELDVLKIDQDNLYTGDIYMIVASGTADVRFVEI